MTAQVPEQLPGSAVPEVVHALVRAHHGTRGALLPILHAVQAELGHVPAEAIPVLARELNISRAEVHGVVSFYRDFRGAPAGTTSVRICRAEACQAVGANRLSEHARRGLGIEFGETTSDGSVSLDEVFCLGNCALGPAAQVNGRLYGRVDAGRLDALLEREVRR